MKSRPLDGEKPQQLLCVLVASYRQGAHDTFSCSVVPRLHAYGPAVTWDGSSSLKVERLHKMQVDQTSETVPTMSATACPSFVPGFVVRP